MGLELLHPWQKTVAPATILTTPRISGGLGAHPRRAHGVRHRARGTTPRPAAKRWLGTIGSDDGQPEALTSLAASRWFHEHRRERISRSTLLYIRPGTNSPPPA